MSRPAARVLALLELLQAGGTHRVGMLADRLGVDERTVRRYATHLIDLGVPVHAVRGRYGGYRLAPGYKLPPLMLTDDEALAVALGLLAARRLGLVADQGPAADLAAAKLRRVLPRALSHRLDALLATLDFTAAERSATPAGTAALLDLAQATQAHRTVTIDYSSWDGRTGERRMDPYGLVFHSGRWYATGHDHGRGDIRTFRVDRIARVRVTDDRYEVPDGFDPAVRVQAGIAAVGWRHKVAVVLHTTLDSARRRLPPTVGALTEVDGGVRLDARAERLDGMARMLAGLGWSFTIEAPAELRAEVRSLAERLHRDAG